MSVENMALASRFMEARAKGDLAAVDEMMAPHRVLAEQPLQSRCVWWPIGEKPNPD